MKARSNALWLVFVSLATGPLSAQPLAVTARRALDVETGKLIENPVLRIEGGVIRSIKPRTPSDQVTHDLGDVTLLPGLVDCHVHLAGREETTPFEALQETAARAAVEGAVNARKTVEAGFTTVRDLGSRDLVDVALRDVIASGRLPGPRMLVAVASLSATGGHGDLNELPPDIEVHRYSGVADGVEEVRRKVRQNIKNGADWIKVLATGGVGSSGTDPRQADYTEEELRAAVATAREKGRDVAAHAHGTTGILRAARAGVRSVEHGSMLNDEAIAALKENGTYMVSNPYTNQYMIARGTAGGYQEYQLKKSREVYQMKLESLRRAIKAGVLLAYGTDAGVQTHGNNGKQLAIYVEAGMTPLQAIQSATTVASRLLRMETRIGKLGEGFYADVVAVTGDPLANIRTLEEPVWVMKEGRVVLDRTKPAASAPR